VGWGLIIDSCRMHRADKATFCGSFQR